MRKLIITVLLCIFCSFSYGGVSSDIKTVPIGNKSIEKDVLTDVEIYAIFTLVFHYWEDGNKIYVFLLDDIYGEHKDFLWEFLGLSPTRYTELIESKVASGQASKPVSLSSEKKMIEIVSQTRGAIGYIGSGKFVVPDGENNVKTFKIIFN